MDPKTDPIGTAVATLSGKALVAFLVGYKFLPTPSEGAAPAVGTPAFGDWYVAVRDQGTGYTPGTWSQVEYLRNVGKLPNAVYTQALTGLLAKSSPTP